MLITKPVDISALVAEMKKTNLLLEELVPLRFPEQVLLWTVHGKRSPSLGARYLKEKLSSYEVIKTTHVPAPTHKNIGETLIRRDDSVYLQLQATSRIT
jgi:hypothetical protein